MKGPEQERTKELGSRYKEETKFKQTLRNKG